MLHQNHTLKRQLLDPARRYLWPLASVFLLLVLEPALRTPLSVFAPSLGFCALLYWSGFREDRIPAVPAFLLGLLADTLSGTPLGLHALLFLFANRTFLLLAQTAAITRFAVAWMLVVAALALATFIVGIEPMLAGAVLPSRLVYHVLISAAVYPLLAWCFELTVVRES